MVDTTYKKILPEMLPEATETNIGAQFLISRGSASTATEDGSLGTQILGADNTPSNDRTKSTTNAGVQATVAHSSITECSTPASTVNKVAPLTGFILNRGSLVYVKFIEGNTAPSITLNINNTGAKSVHLNGVSLQGTEEIVANRILGVQYNGTSWDIVAGMGAGGIGDLDLPLDVIYGGTGVDNVPDLKDKLGLGRANGPIPVDKGGTGLTSSPTCIVDLNSSESVRLFQANPIPGVTGILPESKGGTGFTSLSDLADNVYIFIRNKLITDGFGGGGSKPTNRTFTYTSSFTAEVDGTYYFTLWGAGGSAPGYSADTPVAAEVRYRGNPCGGGGAGGVSTGSIFIPAGKLININIGTGTTTASKRTTVVIDGVVVFTAHGGGNGGAAWAYERWNGSTELLNVAIGGGGGGATATAPGQDGETGSSSSPRVNGVDGSAATMGGTSALVTVDGVATGATKAGNGYEYSPALGTGGGGGTSNGPLAIGGRPIMLFPGAGAQPSVGWGATAARSNLQGTSPVIGYSGGVLMQYNGPA